MIRSIIQGGIQIQPKLLGPCLLRTGLKPVVAYDVQSISSPNILSQQARTTFILKRRTQPPLSKVHNRSRRLKGRHFVYELVEDTNNRKDAPVKLILTSAVEGLGSKGDVVEVSPFKARNYLLLPGLAVYASPENLDKYGLTMQEDIQDQPSSPFARKTASELSTRVIHVSMNMKKPWRVEPWHVRVAFRKAGIIVPEEAITLPSQPIEGPDLSIQNKEFLVKVKINNKEEAPVRCRINHCTSKPSERLPFIPFHWQYMAEPLFLEEASILEELAKRNPMTRLQREDE